MMKKYCKWSKKINHVADHVLVQQDQLGQQVQQEQWGTRNCRRSSSDSRTRNRVSFSQDGPNSGSGITRTSASSFNLVDIGTYQILFEVGTDEAGQLILTLNGSDLPYTVVGRATGTTQIIGMAIVTTTVINSILTVRNPAGNAPVLTITPSAGGTRPVSEHLVILQIA